MRDPAIRNAALRARGYDPAALVLAGQVHGTRIARAGALHAGTVIAPCDGLMTDDPGLVLGILTADCLPVFLWLDGRAAAVVHAGWRGLSGGIIGRAVEEMRAAYGIAPHELSAAIGPHICARCYPVGIDVHRAFGLPGPAGPLDLWAAACARLSAAGVTPPGARPACTAHDPGFFSHRRGDTEARMISLITVD